MTGDSQDRIIIISSDGREVDITGHVRELLRSDQTRDYTSADGAADVRRFAVNLILVAGKDAPAQFIRDYAEYMSPNFERFLWKTWRPVMEIYKSLEPTTEAPLELSRQDSHGSQPDFVRINPRVYWPRSPATEKEAPGAIPEASHPRVRAQPTGEVKQARK